MSVHIYKTNYWLATLYPTGIIQGNDCHWNGNESQNRTGPLHTQLIKHLPSQLLVGDESEIQYE